VELLLLRLHLRLLRQQLLQLRKLWRLLLLLLRLLRLPKELLRQQSLQLRLLKKLLLLLLLLLLWLLLLWRSCCGHTCSHQWSEEGQQEWSGKCGCV
jgi:hypothetical protein